MKHAREDYNRIQDPAGIIPEDEPVFLLRGQDPLAPIAVAIYAEAAEAQGASKEFVDNCREQANCMEQWVKDHSSPVRIPDL